MIIGIQERFDVAGLIHRARYETGKIIGECI